MITSFELLSKEDCHGLRAELEKFKFIDGKTTANGYAKELKENFQLEGANPEAAYIFDQVKGVLLKNPTIRKFFLPVSFPRMFANYYAGGHRYDWHIDLALMNGMRTDFSFTIALGNPDTYEGGALEMKLPNGEIAEYRLDEGHIVLYPTGQLHRVTEVTSGFRLSIVGWLQSALGDKEDRELHAEYVDLMNFVVEKYEPSWEDLNNFNQFKQKFIRRLLK